MRLVPLGTSRLVSWLGMTSAFAACIVPVAAGLAWLLVMVREPRTMEVAGCEAADPAGDGGSG